VLDTQQSSQDMDIQKKKRKEKENAQKECGALAIFHIISLASVLYFSVSSA
jgi:hypothetical protein